MSIESFLTQLEDLRPWLENALASMIQPWRLYQVAILIVCFALAHVLANRLRERIREWMRGLDATKGRLRLLINIERRLRPILFAVLVWISVLAIRATTWPSRSYLLALAASLVTAWVFVAIASRLISNRLLRLFVTWGAWVFVTLNILGVLPEAIALLDSAAITFGDIRVSLLALLKGVTVLAVMLMAATSIARVAVSKIGTFDDVSPSIKVLLEKLITISLYALAVIIGLQAIGFELTNFALLSGAIGLGIGFGLQKVVSNLISGIILLLDESIKPGDVISLGETFGWITALGARYVSVVTRDGRVYLIPNEDLITGQVVNWSRSSNLVRLDIDFGVSYNSDPHKVRTLAVDAARKVRRVAIDPAPVCHVVGFGDSSIDFILRFWINDPSGGLTNVRGDVFLSLWDELKDNNVTIPYPRRDVSLVDNPKASES